MRRCKKGYPKILCWSVLNLPATAVFPNEKMSSKLTQFCETFLMSLDPQTEVLQLKMLSCTVLLLSEMLHCPKE